jgi:hypothetical protein
MHEVKPWITVKICVIIRFCEQKRLVETAREHITLYKLGKQGFDISGTGISGVSPEGRAEMEFSYFQ